MYVGTWVLTSINYYRTNLGLGEMFDILYYAVRKKAHVKMFAAVIVVGTRGTYLPIDRYCKM